MAIGAPDCSLHPHCAIFKRAVNIRIRWACVHVKMHLTSVAMPLSCLCCTYAPMLLATIVIMMCCGIVRVRMALLDAVLTRLGSCKAALG